MGVIGIRIDALDKALGKTKYTDDLPEDCWYGLRVGATVTTGKLKKITFDESFDWNGFVRLTALDLDRMGVKEVGDDEERILVRDEVRYYGQSVVLLAHRDEAKLREAAEHVQMEFEKGEVLNEIFGEKIIEKGNFEKAVEEADISIKREFSTQAQEHLYLETQIVVVNFEKEKGVLWITGATQAPFSVKREVERVTPEIVKEVVVEPMIMGGAFGGKEDFAALLAMQAGVLAIASGKKIKLRLSREEDMMLSTKRHPSHARVELAVRDGKLIGLTADLDLDAGAFETISGIVFNRAVLHVGGYSVPNARINGRIMGSSTPPNGAFRGFGAPQAFFGVECLVDELIQNNHLDEVDFRVKNLAKRGDLGWSGQTMFPGMGMDEVFGELVDWAEYRKLKGEVEEFNQMNRHAKRGIGLANVMHGTGYTGFQDIDGPVEIRMIRKGERVEIHTSAVEFGQGVWTALVRIAAAKLGIAEEKITIVNLSTRETPSSGPTVASRSVTVLGNLVARAAEKLKDKKEIREKYSRKGIEFNYENLQGKAYENYAAMSLLVLVEVNLLTYIPKVIKVWAVVNAGKIISEENARSQVEGGILQGIGYTLYEEMKMSEKGYVNQSLASYTFPTIQETPEIEVKFVGQDEESKGLGEMPVSGVAPAVVNAISNAIGKRFYKLPVTPELVCESFFESE